MPECEDMRRGVRRPGGRALQACQAERDSYYRGAICGRCNVDLDPEGYCQNDRCPFSARHQDEGGADDEPLDDEEWEYIQKVVLPRLSGGQHETRR